MPSAPARFAIEATLLVSLGVALALADVDLLLFAAIVAASLAVLAALERTVLQTPSRRERALDDDDEGLPLHESGVARDHPAAPVTDPIVAAAGSVQDTAEPVAAATPTWRPPVADDRADEPEQRPGVPDAVELDDGGEAVREPDPVDEAEATTATARIDLPPDSPRERGVPDESEPVSHGPSPVAQASRPPLESVPSPVSEQPEPEPERRPAVVELPARGPREWNLWDLERRARERSGEDAIQDEEWGALFVHLREYASPDGMLPAEFDELVRESFAGLLVAGSR